MPLETAKKPVLRMAFAAVAVSAALVAAKGAAWLAGGSTAMLASLVDSIIDVGVSLSNFFALRYAFQPADDDHRFGHGKAEGIAALGQAAFITGSAVFVMLEAARHFVQPSAPVGAIGLSVTVLACGMMVTLALTFFQARAAKESGSLALDADAAHYKSDIVMTLGLVGSLLLSGRPGMQWVDPAAAVAVAAWLLFNAWGVARKAADMLLDRELAELERARIISLINATPGVLGFHDLRTRRSGTRVMISFDVEVEPQQPVCDAHEITRKTEARLLQAYPHAEVMIHMDPRGDVTDSRHRHLKEFHGR